MDKKYGLEDFKVLSGNSFSKGDLDLLYFSIDKADKLTCFIREKINSMINHLIHEYEKEHGDMLDIKQFEADARFLISFANSEHRPEHTIDVTISSCDSSNKDILLYNEFVVLPGTEMFEIFRGYFMNRLDETLFGERAS